METCILIIIILCATVSMIFTYFIAVDQTDSHKKINVKENE